MNRICWSWIWSFAGDVAFQILETLNSVKHRATQDVLEDNLHEETQILVCDINPNMLNVGKKWVMERGKIKGVSKLTLDKLCVMCRGLRMKFVSEILHFYLGMNIFS